jgi:hypothetical protein
VDLAGRGLAEGVRLGLEDLLGAQIAEVIKVERAKQAALPARGELFAGVSGASRTRLEERPLEQRRLGWARLGWR